MPSNQAQFLLDYIDGNKFAIAFFWLTALEFLGSPSSKLGLILLNFFGISQY